MKGRNRDKDSKAILGYLPKYIELCHVRVSSNVLNFTVYGIFAGLLLSGFVTDVPVLALGIGLAVGSFLSLLLLLYYGQKESEAKLDLDEILARAEGAGAVTEWAETLKKVRGERLRIWAPWRPQG